MNMPNESQNKLPLWKNKLEALDGLAGETFNKAHGWEKLHTRLYAKSSIRRIRWYWIAAACLLLTLSIIGLLETKKDIPVAKRPSKQKQLIPKETSEPTPIFKNDSAKVVTFAHTNKKPRKPLSAKLNKVIPTANNNLFIDTPLAKQSNAQDTSYTIIPADTPPLTGVKVQPRQKFRVIHINELSNPVEEVRFVRNEGGFFPIKITNKDIFSGSPANNHSGHNILKINLSPQN